MRAKNIFIYNNVKDSNLIKELGKIGTKIDYSVYHSKDKDHVLSFFTPNNYPTKIQSVLFSLYMSDFCVLNIQKIDRDLAEVILLLNLFKKPGMLLLNGISKSDISIFNKTIVKDYAILDLLENPTPIPELKKRISESMKQNITDDLPTIVPIDVVYNIKSVGLVVLGLIKQGRLKVHDNLFLLPTKKQVSVKALQLHDKDVKEILSSNRCGVNLKGAKSTEIEKGNVLVSDISVAQVFSNVSAKILKSKFYTADLETKKSLFIYTGLQYINCTSEFNKETSTLSLKLLKPIVYIRGNPMIIIDPDSKKQRIVGELETSNLQVF